MKERTKTIITYLIGFLACIAFFWGFIDAMAQRRNKIELQEKAQHRYDDSVHSAYLDSMNIERLEQRATDSIHYLQNDKWEQLQIKNGVIPNKK